MDYYALSEGMAALPLWRRHLGGYRLHRYTHRAPLTDVVAQSVVIPFAGYVRQSHLDLQGRELATALYGPGHTVGDPFHEYGSGPSQFRAQGALQAWVLARSEFIELLAAERGLARALLELLAVRERTGIDRLADFGLADVSTRTARLLASLMTTHGSRCRHGHQLDIRLTHQELSEMVGAARSASGGGPGSSTTRASSSVWRISPGSSGSAPSECHAPDRRPDPGPLILQSV